jgi:hypothetical protein
VLVDVDARSARSSLVGIVQQPVSYREYDACVNNTSRLARAGTCECKDLVLCIVEHLRACSLVVHMFQNAYLYCLSRYHISARLTRWDVGMSKSMSANQKIKWLVAAIISLASITVVYSVTTAYVSLHNTVTLKGIGVGAYTNSSCLQRVNSVDWGLAGNGTTLNMTVYIRNEGNAPATLSLQTANWNPSNASQYASLTWSYSGQSIAANDGVSIVLFLTVASNIQGIPTFSFDIIISASG